MNAYDAIERRVCHRSWAHRESARILTITSPHSLAETFAPGYFRVLHEQLEPGDWLFINAGAGGPNELREFAIAAVSDVSDGEVLVVSVAQSRALATARAA